MRVFFMACVSAVLLMTAALAARSDEVPVLNVSQVCRGIAQQGMDPSETGGPDLAMSQCVASEQEVRGQLVKAWSTFAADDKHHCTLEATTGGEASYTDLITCLEMARDVRRMQIPRDHPLEDIMQ
jgi:opacity protein-like surface antigen